MLVLLVPAGLAFVDAGHTCACGMKKSACFCDLLARRSKLKKDGCSGMSGSCSMRSKAPVNSTPRPGFDFRDGVGVLTPRHAASEPSPGRLPLDRDVRQPLSLSEPPEAPPPRSLPLV